MENQITVQQSISVSGRVEALLKNRPVILQLLRFVAIGVINTALDFIILNFFSKLFGIEHGLRLGYLNIISFSIATIQSYIWNRYWAFEQGSDTSLIKNFVRLTLVGGLGFIAFVAVLFGASQLAVPGFYFILLFVFIIAEAMLWFSFKFERSGSQSSSSSVQFISFVVVSVIGLLINSGIISLISGSLSHVIAVNPDLIKNIAKALATGASLVWNFVGYKLIVFKR